MYVGLSVAVYTARLHGVYMYVCTKGPPCCDRTASADAENLQAGMRMTKRTGSMNGRLYGMVVALRGRGEL